MENTNDLKVTTIDELKNYAQGNLVELPSFGEGQKFVARLKRPSLMNLIKMGKIPNSLLSSANSLFEKGPGMIATEGKYDEEITAKMFDIIDVICEAAFVSPTYKEIKDSGIELTDQQYLFVFDYTQNGVKSLESFR